MAHTHDVKSEIQEIPVESTQKCDRYLDMKEPNGDSYRDKHSSHFYSGNDVKDNYVGHLVECNGRSMDEGEIGRTFHSEERNSDSSRDDDENFEKKLPGTLWDVFRREDVPKLMEYLEKNWKELGNIDSVSNAVSFFFNRTHTIEADLYFFLHLIMITWFGFQVAHHLFDEAVYLSWKHKRQLKDEFGKLLLSLFSIFIHSVTCWKSLIELYIKPRRYF